MKTAFKIMVALAAMVGAVFTIVVAYDCIRAAAAQAEFRTHILEMRSAVESRDDVRVMRAEVAMFAFMEEKKKWLPAIDQQDFDKILHAGSQEDWVGVIAHCDDALGGALP